VISSAIKDQNLFYIFNILTNNSDMCLHKRWLNQVKELSIEIESDIKHLYFSSQCFLRGTSTQFGNH
jgi:hypothetical protein